MLSIYVAIFILGLFIGSDPDGPWIKGLALAGLALFHASVLYSTMGDVSLLHPLDPATVDYIGRVVLFLIVGLIGASITNTLAASRT